MLPHFITNRKRICIYVDFSRSPMPSTHFFSCSTVSNNYYVITGRIGINVPVSPWRKLTRFIYLCSVIFHNHVGIAEPHDVSGLRQLTFVLFTTSTQQSFSVNPHGFSIGIVGTYGTPDTEWPTIIIDLFNYPYHPVCTISSLAFHRRLAVHWNVILINHRHAPKE